LLPRFQGLDRERQLLLLEALITLTLTSAALHVLPFKRAIRLGSIGLGIPKPRMSVESVVWAIEAVGRRLPWKIVCIQSGLAAQRMMRRRGIEAILHYGIANERPSSRLEAHVWVSVNGKPVLGGAEAREFVPVATYPES
jgi:hypothetical protein